MANPTDIWDIMELVHPLELESFWSLIEKSRLVSQQERIAHHVALSQILSLVAPEEVASFKKTFSELSSRANNDEVHDVIGGSDDGFHYGISGLIGMGRESYDNLMFDPQGFNGTIVQNELLEYASNDAFDEPSRLKLQAVEIARQERGLLEASVSKSSTTKHGLRV